MATAGMSSRAGLVGGRTLPQAHRFWLETEGYSGHPTSEVIPENLGVVATDDVPPQVTGLALTPEPPAAQQPFVITWTATDNATPAGQLFSAALVDVPFEQWTDATAPFSVATALNVAGLSAGVHRVYVVVADENGNLGAATRAFRVGACVERADALLASAQLPPLMPSTLFSEDFGVLGSKAALEADGWQIGETNPATTPPGRTWKTVTTIEHSGGAPTETLITEETVKASFGIVQFSNGLQLHAQSDGGLGQVKMTRTIPTSPGGRAFLSLQGGTSGGPPGAPRFLIRVGGPA